MTRVEAQEILKKYNQQHVLAFYDELSDNEKENLLKQIELVDFELMKKLYQDVDNEDKLNLTGKVEPIKAIDKSALNLDDFNKYLEQGIDKIKCGKLGFVTMAGGQGTRLGHNGPKGTFILDNKNNKSLFELLCDTLKEARTKYGVTIPWYIMTSRENNNDTIDYFSKMNYFDYGKDNIKFFIQGELPMLLENGQVVMESKGSIKFAADGHGGIFSAMMSNGIVHDMKEKGIEWIFISGVDNSLIKMVDPLLIGMCESLGYILASKTKIKSSPTEKVGIFCKKDGRPAVVEYTEVDSDMANMVDELGQYVYGESHILANLFNISLLEKMNNMPLKLHKAHKKTNYIDEKGNMVIPDNPNAYKFESFIFDAFGLANDILLLRINSADEFAPLKNKEGEDSIETARKLLYEYLKNKGE